MSTTIMPSRPRISGRRGKPALIRSTSASDAVISSGSRRLDRAWANYEAILLQRRRAWIAFSKGLASGSRKRLLRAAQTIERKLDHARACVIEAPISTKAGARRKLQILVREPDLTGGGPLENAIVVPLLAQVVSFVTK